MNRDQLPANERYNWKNLSPAERLVQRTGETEYGVLTCSWRRAQFEPRTFEVAVKLAARVLYLEKKLRQKEIA